MEKLAKQLEFLVEIDKMKAVYRQTLLMDKTRQESDAEHSWHFAIMALTLQEHASEKVDINRVIRMALVHDLVEIYAGDTFAYDEVGCADKEGRERAAADRLFALLPKEQGAEYRQLWEEFDSMATADSQYAAAIDRLQPFISNHHTEGHTWRANGVAVDKVYKRMSPVKTALPSLWEYVEQVIKINQSKGHIKP